MADIHPPTPTDDPSQSTVPERERWKHEDPKRHDHGRKGMLLSNEIEWFCDRGRRLLINDGYEPQQLRPAAYTLRIGRDYVDSRGKRGRLSGNSFFYIEPNSIAYASTFESLDLPYYIAARFNLRVRWVYKGILLGTGPQVEPGYKGYLSCPLFNLTDKAIKVNYKEAFATIDFERTSDFCPGKDWNWIQQNIRPSSDVEKLDQVTAEAQRFLLFRQRPYEPLELLPDWDVVSSLMELSNEVKTWRNIGIGMVLAFFGLALSLLSFQNNLYRDVRALDTRLSESRQMESTVEPKVKALHSQLDEAREAVRALESRVKMLEGSKSGGAPTAGKGVSPGPSIR